MNTNSPRLLDRLANAIRIRNYSYRTEQAYAMWIRQFIHFHQLQHPQDMGEREVSEFLNHLSVVRKVSPSTQNQALQALKFLYANVLGNPLEPLGDIVKAKKPKKLPVVLTRVEIKALLKELEHPYWLIAALMYGSGLRLMEAMRLRVRDLEFEYRAILIRND